MAPTPIPPDWPEAILDSGRNRSVPGPEPSAPNADNLADRLDHLSRADAERVPERAIRIQTQRHSTDSFTPEQIERIAAEPGPDGSVVDRAMREHVAEPPPSRSRMLGSDRLVWAGDGLARRGR